MANHPAATGYPPVADPTPPQGESATIPPNLYRRRREVPQVLISLFKLWKNQDGQGMVEYGLIIALVAVAVIATVTLLGG